MKTPYAFKVFVLITLLFSLLIPITPAHAAEGKSLPAFADFVARVKNGQADVVRGVYVAGVMANQVVPQPANNPGYISTMSGTVTQFSMAEHYKVIGLLAHNNLAGASFSNLVIGQEVRIIYGDGRVVTYSIDKIARFQALQPSNENSDFVDLSTNTTYSAQAVFKMFYQGGNHVTFQTCISQDGNLSWGRLFVTATPTLR
jgi:hypothetical protein